MPPSTNRYEALSRKVTCSDCRRTFTVRGIGPHRMKVHSDTWTPGPAARANARRRARLNAETPPEGGDPNE